MKNIIRIGNGQGFWGDSSNGTDKDGNVSLETVPELC